MNTPCVRSAKGEESKVVLLISLLAIVHVFCFSAAFPFFGIVDEQAHIDLSVRYSHGEIPRGISLLCPEAKPFFLIYGTPEYIWPPETQPGNIYPAPPWKQSFTNAASLVLSRYVAWKYDDNHEASQPPLYYGLAGAWWRIGKMFNLDGLALLYWLRFLNIPIVAALVWLGWLTARQVFPDRQFARLTVPALIAFMPQTSFYSINNDVLAPGATSASMTEHNLVYHLYYMHTASANASVPTRDRLRSWSQMSPVWMPSSMVRSHALWIFAATST